MKVIFVHGFPRHTTKERNSPNWKISGCMRCDPTHALIHGQHSACAHNRSLPLEWANVFGQEQTGLEHNVSKNMVCKIDTAKHKYGSELTHKVLIENWLSSFNGTEKVTRQIFR